MLKNFDTGVLKNATALFGLQSVSYVIPLISLPLLTRTLSVDEWGRYSFALYLGIMAGQISEYGINISGTRMIAIHRSDSSMLRHLFCNLYATRIFLSIVLIPILLAGGYLIPIFKGQTIFLILSVGVMLVNGLNPLWAFQGIERMSRPSLAYVVANALFTLSLFLFVRASDDGALALALYLIWNTLATGLLIFWANRLFGFQRPDFKSVFSMIKTCRSVFIGRIGTILINSLFTLTMGILSTPFQTGLYAGAERLFRAGHSLLSPLSLAIYPRMSLLLVTDRDTGLLFYRKVSLLMVGGSLVLALVLYFPAPFVITLLFGPKFEPSMSLFQLGVLATPLVAINNILATQWLLPNSIDRIYNRAVLINTAFMLLCVPLCVLRWNAAGAVYAMIASEAFSALTYGYFSWKYTDIQRVFHRNIRI
jgi:PST family polysaccharide transporter